MTDRKGVLKGLGLVISLVIFGVAIVLMGTSAGHASSPDIVPPPPEGAYTIDPAHSFAYFGARHHIVGLVRGRFDKVTGTITGAKQPSDCALDVSIDTTSINTQIPRDQAAHR